MTRPDILTEKRKKPITQKADWIAKHVPAGNLRQSIIAAINKP